MKFGIRELISQIQTDLLVVTCKFNVVENEIDRDIAIIDMKAAEDKLNLLLKKAKEMELSEAM